MKTKIIAVAAILSMTCLAGCSNQDTTPSPELAEAQSQVEILTSELDSCKNDLEICRNVIAEYEANRTTDSTLQSDYEALQSKYDALASEHIQTQEDLADAQNKISSLEKELATYKSKPESDGSSAGTSSSENTSGGSSGTPSGSAETLTFEGFEISFDISKASFTTLSNRYSELDGKSVIAIPTMVTNNTGGTDFLNMLYVTIFGPKGTKLKDVFIYFDDGCKIFEEMRAGATVEGHTYVLYDGDGTYTIELSDVGRSEVKEYSFKVG